MSSSARQVRRTGATRDRFSAALVVSLFAALLSPGLSQAADADIAAPVVSSSSAAPSLVNVTSSSQVVTVTFHVIDGSGLRVTPTVTGYSDLSPQSTAPGVVTLVAGTPLDGTYSAQLTVPKSAFGGGWTAKADALVDSAGNSTAGQVTLARFTVFDLGLDTIGPRLVSSSITPTSVDVTAGPATVVVSLHVTDNVSGARDPVVVITAPGGLVPNAGGVATLVSGDANDGVWTLAATIAKGSQSGLWSVLLLPLIDQFGNSTGTSTALGTIAVTTGVATVPGGAASSPTASSTATSAPSRGTTSKPGDQGGVLGTRANSRSFITLVSKSVKISKGGSMTAALHCTGFARCRGSVRVYRTANGKKLKLVSRRVAIGVRKTVKVRFTLTRSGKKSVLRGKTYKTSVSIWTDGIAAPRKAKLTIKRVR